MPQDYSHGADSLAAGLLAGSQPVGRGLARKLAYEDQLREREAKAATLAALIEQAQTSDVIDNAGQPTGETERMFPAPEELPPDLLQGAGRYGLLDYYMQMRRAAQPTYDVEDGSIIKKPADGGIPQVVKQLPVRQKPVTPKDQAFGDAYRTFVSSGMSPDKAFEAAMKAAEAGRLAVEDVKQTGATGRTEKTNASRERIAKMNNETRRFTEKLKADANVRRAEITSGSKSKAKLSMVIPSYPGKIGGALQQMRYEANPNDPKSLELVYDKINTRIRQLDEMARGSGASKSEKVAGVTIPFTGTSAKEAKEKWNRFVAQFADGGILSMDNPSVDDMRRILNTQNAADGGDGTLYDEADEQTVIDDFGFAQDAAIGYDELTGDMRLMGQEYINDIVFKRHLEEVYGLAPAVEQQGGGGGEGGGGGDIEQMKQELLDYAREQGVDADPQSMDDVTDADIREAYRMMQDEKKKAGGQ